MALAGLKLLFYSVIVACRCLIRASAADNYDTQGWWIPQRYAAWAIPSDSRSQTLSTGTGSCCLVLLLHSRWLYSQTIEFETASLKIFTVLEIRSNCCGWWEGGWCKLDIYWCCTFKTNCISFFSITPNIWPIDIIDLMNREFFPLKMFLTLYLTWK